MKQRIFNKGNGWYISASNYKDKDDKAYMSVYFPNGTEPLYKATADSNFVFVDIDILEQKYGSYHNKMTLTVFKYELEGMKGELTEVDRDTHAVELSPEDLPFY